MKPLHSISTPINRAPLVELAHRIQGWKPFSTGNLYNCWSDSVESWQQLKVQPAQSPEIQRLTNIWAAAIPEAQFQISYYAQKPGWDLPRHSDNSHTWPTTCAINCVLTGDSPIIFDKPYRYSLAILNVTEPHSVPSSATPRLILKWAVFGPDYETCVRLLDAADLIEPVKMNPGN